MHVRWDVAVTAAAVALVALVLFLWPDVLACLAGCWR